jgi:hypothetical protein
LTLAPPRRSHRRRKAAKPSPLERDLLVYLDLVMADDVAAANATHVVLMHRGLVAWMTEATFASVLLYQPYRLPGDERPGGVAVGGSVTVSRDPDDAMVELVDRRLAEGGHDPERLDPVRQKLADLLGRDASWYLKIVGQVDLAEWEPLAVRLGDFIGDQVAANALATSLLGHRHLVHAGTTDQRKAARERWRRQHIRYVQIRDEQRTKVDRPVVQTVEGEGERRFG